MSDSILLYSRSTSSASYRVRIALNLKQQKYDTKTMGPAEQHHKSAEYLKINPQGLVPLLFHKSGTQEARLNQSVAIMEYLQEVFPKEGYALLPGDTLGRARVRSLALHIACEMQPLNNSGPVKYLRTDVKASADTVTEWSRHWAEKGFTGLEAELASSATGNFCHGDSPTMADCCLVPQVFRCTLPRVGLNLDNYPQIQKIYKNCLDMPQFQHAMPEEQPDAPEEGFWTSLEA